MAVSEGRALVVGELIKIAKETGIVRSNQVTEATGLPRQLVHHHMKQLASLGHIEHFGNGVYGHVQVDRMIDDFTLERDPTQASRPQANFIVSDERAALLNAAIDFYHITLGIIPREKSLELKNAILNNIDEATKNLKKVRKYTADLKPVKPQRRWKMLKFPRAAITPGIDVWTAKEWLSQFPEAVAFAFDSADDFEVFFEEAAQKAFSKPKFAKGDDEWEKGE